MNINEAKTILLLHRPGLAEADDPQMAAALELAKKDAELARWFGEHCARQEVLRGRFRQIAVPAGLKEQIISEQASRERIIHWRPRLALAAAAIVLVFLSAFFWWPHHPADDTLAIYQDQMARIALRGYYMDLTTNDPVPIRDHFVENQAPADYVLPAGLAKAPIVGCAVQGWQTAKVSMICFHSGRPQPPGQAPDLWLFVVDRAAIPDAPEPGPARIFTINRLTAAVWTQGDKVYLLGLAGDDPATLQKFL